jgi:hypothetical protein
MIRPIVAYQMLVDDLREARRHPGHKPEDDREDLALLTDIYELLTDEERAVVEGEGWRSWPDLHDERTAR